MTASPSYMGIMRASIGLTHMMLESQRLLAANPETAPDILRELSRSDDRAIRQAVAGNPNVPIDVLWELVADFPDEVVANPCFVLITFTNFNWIQDLPAEKLMQLLRLPNCPEIFVKEAVKYDDRDVDYAIKGLAARKIVATPNTSITLLEGVALECGIVWSSIMEHPDFGLESLKRLAMSNDSYFQSDLISCCLIDGHDGLIWPQHLDRQEIINNIIPELMRSITSDDVRISLLEKEELPKKFAPELIKQLSTQSLLYLANSVDTPITILRQIVEIQFDDRNLGPDIHQAAAQNIQAQQHPNSPK
jgi:hypothetical protein